MKNEKINGSIIRHRYHHCILCFTDSGFRWRRSLIIDLAISLYCETKKNTGLLTCVFLCGIAVTVPTGCPGNKNQSVLPVLPVEHPLEGS
jgi:hypothetical protein